MRAQAKLADWADPSIPQVYCITACLKTPQILSIDEILNDPQEQSRPVIDVRTPAEYQEDHLPGAVNHPVLSNEQRVLVGTINRQFGSFEANVKGAALVTANIAALLGGPFRCMPQGLGSPALLLARRIALLVPGDGAGPDRLASRAARRRLSQLPAAGGARPRHAGVAIAVPGAGGADRFRQDEGAATGCQAQGAQVLDLEALARHRGSVLGSVPDAPQPSQKAFDALLWRSLRAFDPARPVLVESESRKIGQLHLPESLMLRMRASPCVSLEVPIEVRIRLLRDQYPHFEEDREGLHERLERLVPLYQDKRVAEWRSLADAGRWDELVERLLLEHYDPAYQRSMGRNYRRVADGAGHRHRLRRPKRPWREAAQALLRQVPLDREA